MSPKNKIPLVWAEVDLKNLRANLSALKRSLVSKHTEILAVVKADAYGHGMKVVARELARQGVAFFGVANIDEALELRKALPAAKILVLGTFHEQQLPLYLSARIRPSISSLEDMRLVQRAAQRKKTPFAVHVKIDTGMGRLGVWWEDAEAFFHQAVKMRRVRIEGVYTHFSSADHKDGSITTKQIALFNGTLALLKRLNIHPRYFHAANSLGAIRFHKTHLNLVRPGIVLYGLNPYRGGRLSIKLKPLLCLKTRISFLKKTAKGRSISYGATYHTSKPTWIATLPVGYSHGYRLGLSNKAHVIVRGRRCPVVGRVTMDHTLVDVGHVPGVKRWDEVTLIGKQGRVEISAEDIASLMQTIPYEVVCSIHSRIPRFYKHIGK